MGYFGDRMKYFGAANWVIRWVELVFSIIVLVLGGILPLEKIGDTSDLALSDLYNGIYTTSPATRFTVFAGAFATASLTYILLASMVKFMEHVWHACFVLILDILNWIFMLTAWACLCAALSHPVNALIFCEHNHINHILDRTPNIAQDLVSYLNGLKDACNYTYAAIAFGICAWLLFFASIYFTAKIFFYEDEVAEERSKARQSVAGTENQSKSESEVGGGQPTSAPATGT